MVWARGRRRRCVTLLYTQEPGNNDFSVRLEGGRKGVSPGRGSRCRKTCHNLAANAERRVEVAGGCGKRNNLRIGLLCNTAREQKCEAKSDRNRPHKHPFKETPKVGSSFQRTGRTACKSAAGWSENHRSTHVVLTHYPIGRELCQSEWLETVHNCTVLSRTSRDSAVMIS